MRLLAKPHSGKVELPSGGKVPPRIAAATSLYDDDRRTFFFSALPSLWRAGAGDLERPEAFALGVMAHELTHTLQLVPMLARIAAAQKRWHLPERLSDDVVQERFEKKPSLRARLVGRARGPRGRGRRRRSRRAPAPHAPGPHAGAGPAGPFRPRRQPRFRDLEEISLAMEGVAVWAHRKLTKGNARTPGGQDRQGA